MRIFCLGLLMLGSVFSLPAEAEDFFDGLIVSEDMKKDIEKEEIGQTGQMRAGELLDKRPTVLKFEKQKVRTKEAKKEEAAPVIREPAPFGLKWLATVGEIKYLHVQMTPIDVMDAPDSYKLSNLPKPLSAFREVIASFGENDALWRIAAYGKLIDDDAAATKGLAEYRQYYSMLERKYGNAHQFYTPAVENVEESTTNDDGTVSTTVTQRQVEIGDADFLEKLMSGESVLYATFENETVGVTLALLADGDGQTYIVVDYKNLTARRKEKEEIYDAL